MVKTVPLQTLEKPPNGKSKEIETPELRCSFISRLFFSWMTPLLVIASKGPITQNDLIPLREDCYAENLIGDFEKERIKETEAQRDRDEKHLTTKPTSIVKPFLRTQKKLVVTSTIMRVFADSIHYINPILLKLLIDYISVSGFNVTYGLCLAILMFCCAELRSFLLNLQIHGMYQLCIRLHSILYQTIMKKTLCLSPKVRAGRTSGEILNLVAVDVEKLTICILYLQNFLSIPLQLTLAMTFLVYTIGYAAIPGFLVLLIFVPINYFSSTYIKRKQLKQMNLKDARTKMSTELLTGIKVVKFYAWERTFEKKINDLRKLEVRQLNKVNLAGRIVDVANATAPFLVAIASFASFVYIYGNEALTPSVAFVSLALFNQMRQPMRILGVLLNYVVQSMVSNKRIKEFLDLEEIDRHTVGHETDGNAVLLRNASFNWDGADQAALLKKIDLKVKTGELLAIVGAVGSGKSSIVSSILGEMHLVGGKVDVQGSIAYVPQQPWIFNKTLRENILFGKVYDKERYDKIIHACELHKDFAMMDYGDETEIGENGVNLSGGQKARVELARSLYQDCSIYLFDDPLSAVDCVVGRAVFDKVLGPEGLLKNKTRILVTHGLHYTKTVDSIIVLKDGEIVQRGKYDQLKNEVGPFVELLRENEAEEEKEEEEKKALSRAGSLRQSMKEKKNESKNKGQLIEKEQTSCENVNSNLYCLYLKAMGIINSTGFFGFYIFHYAFQILRSIWLSDWSTANTLAHNTTMPENDAVHEITVYSVLGVMETIMVVICFTFLTFGNERASVRLHNPVIMSILRAPITFFDTNPLGRIVNRLAKDMETVDNLGNSFRVCTQPMLHVLMVFILISYAIPPFLFLAVPMLSIYGYIMKYFIRATRQLRRLENINRSPILSIFGESIQGSASIRAYKKMHDVCSTTEVVTNNFIQSRYLSVTSNRWCATRLELLGSSVVLFSAALGTISTRYFGLTPGMVGLSVSYALNITEVLSVAIRMLGDLETNIVSVERVKEYHDLPSEAAWEADPGPPQSWPSNGRISIKNVKMRYREDLPLVLKGVSVEIESGQKVAIIGRTGSGKSSLTLGLFRMIEPAAGNFFIDNMATDQVGLHQLRSKMAIIPQDPVLFSGTLRFNLDPFDRYTDDELWTALEKCQLKTFASSKPEGLNLIISEGGKNMSIGERQLVCLGRALLRGGHIVILDEATAAVDAATDALVQAVVREHFSTSTIIAIAHRLDTIADYDRIVVLDAGEVVEFGDPVDLLKDPTSRYYRMVENTKQM